MSPNAFVWYELSTPDVGGAERFYRGVLGWGIGASAHSNAYRTVAVGPAPVGGILPRADGLPARWVGYIAVDDVDAYAARAVAAGGQQLSASEELPGVGRMIAVADTEGLEVRLFRGSAAPNRWLAVPTSAGTPLWRELYAREPSTAFAFYRTLFGWQPHSRLQLAQLGEYQTFALGGTSLGGLCRATASRPAGWFFYFHAERIEQAAERVALLGGRVQGGPEPVPPGRWYVHCVDPQGAAFGLLGERG